MKNCKKQKEKPKNTEQKSQYKYHALTPIDCVENSDVYIDALEQALQHPDVKNIAITGPYGSGKSSVIRTFFAKCCKKSRYKCLTISLATFTPIKDSTLEVERHAIESSILEQLFYHEKDSNIPDSRFKKIHKQHRLKLFVYALLAVLYTSLAIFLRFPSLLNKWMIGNDFSAIQLLWFNRIAFGICVIGAIFVLYKIARILLGLSVKKLNIKSTEVEIANSNQKSILNHHVDEIIYFFEVTKYRIVVLEDLDRFENQEIFTKLREINYLINNSKKVKQKVVFIYAIKDEMFHDKDRTKFFDFIIPIVPIINSSNSSEILRKEFLTDSQKTDITEDVINDISLFIDDMRLLYNIINEYKIYNQRMSACTFDNNRLLAMIAYKNLFPKDFTQLSQGKGCLYNVIAQKEKIAQKLISQYRKSIESINNKIKQIEEQERPKNLQELRILYLSKIVDQLQTNFVAFSFDNKRISIYDCAKSDDYFSKIKLGKISYYYTDYYNSTHITSQEIKFSSIEQSVDSTMTYQQREELLNQSQIKPLQQQIKQLENKIEAVQSYTLQELIVEGEIKIAEVYKNTDKTNLDNTKQIELIDILLRNGYINENYIEYISIFHPGSLTPEDKQFVLNVLMAKSSPYDYPLYMIDNVLQRIAKKNPAILKQQYTLNFNLMDYILTKASLLYSEPYLIQLQTTNWDFIIKYIERGKNLNYFMDEIAKRRRLFLDYVHSFIPNQLDNYIKLLIVHAQTETLLSFFSTENKNIKYLNSYADFMLLEDEQKKYELVNELNIKFALLSKETSLEDLDYIYRSNAYQINIDVMRTILSKRENWDDLAFNTRNYSYIIENYPEMAKYIQENLSAYIDNVFLKLENNTSIDSARFLELLNTDKLSEEQKKQIIRHLVSAHPFENIADVVCPSLWGEICENKLMAPNWDNIKTIMRSNEINYAKVYTDFLNNLENAEKLSTQKLEEDVIQDEGEVEIVYTLIYNDNICDESYRLLLNAFTDKYVLQPHYLPRNRMQWLIEKDLIEINTDSYKYLKDNHTPLHLDFLEKHLAEFSKLNYHNIQFDAEDIMWILNSTIIIDEKQKIINTIVDTSILTDGNILEKLSTFILNSTNDDYVPNGNLIDHLAIQHELPIDVRKTIFIKYPQYVTDIKVFLTNLGEPYSSLALKDRDTDVPRTDTAFLRVLKANSYIGRFTKRPKRELWMIKKEEKLFQ